MNIVYFCIIQLELISICSEAVKYNHFLPNGLKAYIDSAKNILASYEKRINLRNINYISNPHTTKIKYLDKQYLLYQSVGKENISNCGFLLVAGGLGERLKSNGIKLSLPIDQISGYSYLKLYFRYILSYQNLSGKEILICIMTSESTDILIKRYIKANNYFGLSDLQIYFIKQNNVPSFEDKICNIFYKNGKIVDKPHSHGDIHYLLLKV